MEVWLCHKESEKTKCSPSLTCTACGPQDVCLNRCGSVQEVALESARQHDKQKTRWTMEDITKNEKSQLSNGKVGFSTMKVKNEMLDGKRKNIYIYSNIIQSPRTAHSSWWGHVVDTMTAEKFQTLCPGHHQNKISLNWKHWGSLSSDIWIHSILVSLKGTFTNHYGPHFLPTPCLANIPCSCVYSTICDYLPCSWQFPNVASSAIFLPPKFSGAPLLSHGFPGDQCSLVVVVLALSWCSKTAGDWWAVRCFNSVPLNKWEIGSNKTNIWWLY